MSETTETCDRCGHPWNPHILVATLFSAEHGGLIFCDQMGCECETTWTVEGREGPWYPPPEEVTELRRLAQSGEMEESDEEDEWYAQVDLDQDDD